MSRHDEYGYTSQLTVTGIDKPHIYWRKEYGCFVFVYLDFTRTRVEKLALEAIDGCSYLDKHSNPLKANHE